MSIRVVFFGSPELSVPFLSALVQDADFDVVSVVTQPEKPVGRKAILTKSAVHAFASEHGIPALTYKSLKTDMVAEELSQLHADVFVVVVYGKIIPKAVLEIPSFGCLNVHPSLLPKFRGPSPFQEAIKTGETQTAVSIMLLDEGMDTGPVLAHKIFALDDRETSETIQPKIIELGVPLLLDTLKKWVRKEIDAIPQDNHAATYSKLLTKEDGKIDWTKSAIEIDRMIRAYKPWPGTYFIWNENAKDVRVSVHDALAISEKSIEKAGSVVTESDKLFVVCGDQTKLELLSIQPEGKLKMPPNEYIRGHQTFLHTNLI
jgi:methionyl-tRNA formyltransferase